MTTEEKDAYFVAKGFKVVTIRVGLDYDERNWEHHVDIVHVRFGDCTKSFRFRSGILHGGFGISNTLEYLLSDCDLSEQYDDPEEFFKDFAIDFNDSSDAVMFYEMKRNARKIRQLLGDFFWTAQAVLFDDDYNLEEEVL